VVKGGGKVVTEVPPTSLVWKLLEELLSKKQKKVKGEALLNSNLKKKDPRGPRWEVSETGRPLYSGKKFPPY